MVFSHYHWDCHHNGNTKIVDGIHVEIKTFGEQEIEICQHDLFIPREKYIKFNIRGKQIQ